MIDLTGRVALVLGAGAGVGQAVALTMARLGATVAAADRDALAVSGTAVLGDKGDDGTGQVHDYTVDIADPAAVERARREVERDLGVPHIVVQAAGWGAGTGTGGIGGAEVGGAGAVRAFLDGMIRRGRGGRVVTVAGDVVGIDGAGRPIRTGTEDRVVAFTTTLALEMARYGILVNCVSPGPTDIPHLSGPERDRRALERAIPLRRLAQPDEVASAITFLASDEASYITGQVLSVSGGLTLSG
jgi:2-hydroxycyclohexanecarboxyl-CoA dehydrogenase